MGHLSGLPPRAGPAGAGVAGLADSVLEAVPTGLLVFDAQLSVLLANRCAGTLLGFARARPAASGLADWLRGSPRLTHAAADMLLGRCLAAAASARDGAAPAAGAAVVHPSPEEAPGLGFDIRRLAADGAWALLIEDLAAGAARAAAAPAPAADPLTGLPDRRAFGERLRTALARHPSAAAAEGGCATALLAIDLDRFKAVNDTLGHALGDALLRAAAERLLGGVRGGADLVARLGGDEFAVLATGLATPAEAEALGARLVDLLSRPYALQGHVLTIGASIGLALAPGDAAEPEALLRRADLALRQAKMDGKGLVRRFLPEYEARALARGTLEADLRRALALRQFELHYQPKADLAARRLAGFEALIRWRHPERGLVPPDSFIPLAEQTGLILPIGAWVLRAACEEAARWPGGLGVAVNVAPAQFEGGRVLAAVEDALAASGLPGERLEIEITESALLAQPEAVLEALRALRRLGVRVAMDDFGTGYASLSQLRRFPFDRIKLGRSFVGGMVEDAECAAIVRSVAGLGAALDLGTTAEGVETEAQLARLRAEGFSEVQGYLIGRPVPAEEVARVIAQDAEGDGVAAMRGKA